MWTDRGLQRVALTNLLENAWKYSANEPRSVIEVGLVQVEGESAFFVRDNGCGFDMSYSEKLFQPFQRLHAVGEFEGTGVGLATVQRAVRRHGGEIWGESSVGEGATFYFTLATDERSWEQRGTATPPPPPPTEPSPREAN